MPLTIRLNEARLDKWSTQAGIATDWELARLMGVNPSSLSRIRKGSSQPGAKFMASLVHAFPEAGLDDFFDVVTDEGNAA